MTTAVASAPFRMPASALSFWRSTRRDQRVREESQHKRAEILEAIEHHPDADEGLRRQAEFYRRRLEAGMEAQRDAD